MFYIFHDYKYVRVRVYTLLVLRRHVTSSYSLCFIVFSVVKKEKSIFLCDGAYVSLINTRTA